MKFIILAAAVMALNGCSIVIGYRKGPVYDELCLPCIGPMESSKVVIRRP